MGCLEDARNAAVQLLRRLFPVQKAQKRIFKNIPLLLSPETDELENRDIPVQREPHD
jgi:hypothetical protein